MPYLFTDFETFSTIDLKAFGAYRYAEHPDTEALCYALAFDDSPVGIAVPDDDGKMVFPAGFHEMQDHYIVAHNIEFEKNILKRKFSIDIPWHKWIDTAALAARMSLPRSLEELAIFFSLDVSAKLDANTARKGDSVCRPRKPSKGNPATRWTPQTKPEAFAALYARCRQDVEITREVFKRLLALEPIEREVWQATLEMNERGVKVDLASIPPAKAVLYEDGLPLIAEFEGMVGYKLKSYKKVAARLGLPDVRKPTVRKALRNPKTPPAVHRALEILQALSKSSVGKLDAMVNRAHDDSRVRGSFLYGGAERTLRWSSSGVQFQNFKRGLSHETGVAFDALHNGSLGIIFDGAKRPAPDPALTPTGTIAEMLRGFILGPCYVGDYAQIEARVIAWLAEDEPALQLFRAREDPYCAIASVIYRRPITKKDTAERFMGKQAELGCGYGLGGGGFRALLDDIHDVQIEEDFSKMVVGAYRARHPKIASNRGGLWQRLGDGFVYVVAKKAERVRVTRNIYMGTIIHAGTRYAYIELPSSRRMYYADPQLDSTPKGPCVRFFGRDKYSKGWTYIRTYGGALAGHVTQACAREIIAASILRLRALGYPLVMTVHDEIVSEPWGSLKDFTNQMRIIPQWAEGLPIEVDAFETLRYRK
jgi:DNA polymerase